MDSLTVPKRPRVDAAAYDASKMLPIVRPEMPTEDTTSDGTPKVPPAIEPKIPADDADAAGVSTMHPDDAEPAVPNMPPDEIAPLAAPNTPPESKKPPVGGPKMPAENAAPDMPPEDEVPSGKPNMPPETGTAARAPLRRLPAEAGVATADVVEFLENVDPTGVFGKPPHKEVVVCPLDGPTSDAAENAEVEDA